MNLNELINKCNGKYLVAEVVCRDDNEKVVEADIVVISRDYEDALFCEKLLKIDGVDDILVVPPIATREVPPRELAKFWRVVLGKNDSERCESVKWIVRI